MQGLSKRTHLRLLTDIAFAATIASALSLGVAAAQAQGSSPSSESTPSAPDQERNKSDEKNSSTIGETRAAPAPSLPSQQDRPPISGKPLDEPDKALHSAPPEKINTK